MSLAGRLHRLGHRNGHGVAQEPRSASVEGLKHVLQGRWLGHPLHPIIVHIPIAMFALSLIMDIASMISPQRAFVAAATWSLGLGVLTALLAAAPGFADYSDIRKDHRGRKTANTHMILNLVAVVVYAISLILRWNDTTDRTSAPMLPFVLSIVGIVIISISGYLGGVMVYDDGIGVGRHRRTSAMPDETIEAVSAEDGWADVAPDTLDEGQTLRVKVDQTIVNVIKHRGRMYAVQEFCTHRFGPLSEGTCSEGKITCPWHGSQFNLVSGKVEHGPAKVDLKVFQIAVRGGRIRLRTDEARS